MDKICPSCRTPIVSLMIVDAVKGPEFHCERCERTVVPVKKDAPAPKKPEFALN